MKKTISDSKLQKKTAPQRFEYYYLQECEKMKKHPLRCFAGRNVAKKRILDVDLGYISPTQYLAFTGALGWIMFFFLKN